MPIGSYNGLGSYVGSYIGSRLAGADEGQASMIADNITHSASGVPDDVFPNVNGDDVFSYLDGLFSSVGSENALNREFNAQQAELNRQWTTSMSNTAYQRGMADMKAAGLNPILMFGSGHSAASVPSSSAASYQYGGGDTVSTLLQALGNLATGVSSFLPTISKLLSKPNKIGF